MSDQIDVNAIADVLNNKVDLDAGNLSSSGKETIVRLCMPDYSSGITLESVPDSTTPYVCPSDGVYVFSDLLNNTGSYLYINGAKSGYHIYNSNSYRDGGTITVLLSKGDSIYWSTAFQSVYSNIFYPLKGVN